MKNCDINEFGKSFAGTMSATDEDEEQGGRGGQNVQCANQ